MKLEYAGPKPEISHTGVHIDTNKEDKFVYLNIVIQLIEALDHGYIPNKKYTHTLDKKLSSSEMIHILEKKCSNFKELMDKANHNIENEIEHNIQRVHENCILNLDEKNCLANNIEYMRKYMIQRSVNKSVYYCAMKLLADIVQKDHIDHISIPMKPNYFHVLHSLQGALLKEKAPIDTKLDVYEKNHKLYINLQVINI